MNKLEKLSKILNELKYVASQVTEEDMKKASKEELEEYVTIQNEIENKLDKILKK